MKAQQETICQSNYNRTNKICKQKISHSLGVKSHNIITTNITRYAVVCKLFALFSFVSHGAAPILYVQAAILNLPHPVPQYFLIFSGFWTSTQRSQHLHVNSISILSSNSPSPCASSTVCTTVGTEQSPYDSHMCNCHTPMLIVSQMDTFALYALSYIHFLSDLPV